MLSLRAAVRGPLAARARGLAVKARTSYFCADCGTEHRKWKGQCDACGAWNTMKQAPSTQGAAAPGKGGRRASTGRAAVSLVSAADAVKDQAFQSRISLGNIELDRLVGGGVTAGSLTLLGGSPGAGKSTFALQLADRMAASSGLPIAYISGEESAPQVAARAKRVAPELVANDLLHLLCEADVDACIASLAGSAPAARASTEGWLGGSPVGGGAEARWGGVVVDSIQTMMVPDVASMPGSVPQVRESAVRMLRFAKDSAVPVLLTGHVTKSGDLAGPRVLEHVVDTVLALDGEGAHAHRILRCTKNRFGPGNEVAVLDMADDGLKVVTDPSLLFLSHAPAADREGQPPGTAVAIPLEGSRALCVEVQALSSPSFPDAPPRHRGIGLSFDRTQILMAVLGKRAGVRTARQDVFLSVAGGLRLQEPAADLAVLAAAGSALKDRPVRPRTAFVGEVGLTGEVRPVQQLARRVQAAAGLGFENVVVPVPHSYVSGSKGHVKLRGADAEKLVGVKLPPSLTVVGVASAREALRFALGGGSSGEVPDEDDL